MSTLAAGAFLLLVTSAAAQGGLAERVRRVTVPVGDGGVYSVSSGIWTHSSLVSTRRDVIYDNTCFSGGYYITPAATEVLVDEGQMPGPGSSGCLPGCASSYTINAFQISYCTENTAPEAVIRFDNLYQPCNPNTIFDPEVASFTLVELPGSSEEGLLSCWTITIELDSQSFVLAANGGEPPFGLPKYFGWSIQFTSSQGVSGNEGPILAGDIYEPGSCPRCAGTIWDPRGQGSTSSGTGLGTEDALLYFSSVGTGCIFSHGPFYSLWLELQSDEACPPEPGTPSCFGSDALCPCANGGYVDTGCDNAQGTGGVRLRAFDFAPDGLGGGTVRLDASNFPFSTSPNAIAIRSTSIEGQSVVFGDGLRCVGLPGLVRLAATAANGGISNHLINHGAGSGTFHYQIWYRSQPASFCNASAAFNLSSAYSLTW